MDIKKKKIKYYFSSSFSKFRAKQKQIINKPMEIIPSKFKLQEGINTKTEPIIKPIMQ